MAVRKDRGQKCPCVFFSGGGTITILCNRGVKNNLPSKGNQKPGKIFDGNQISDVAPFNKGKVRELVRKRVFQFLKDRIEKTT